MSYQTIQFGIEDSTGVLRLNRPERMNAVVEEMYLEIRDALQRTRGDPGVRCLILTGSVLRRNGVEKPAFCSGADLKRHASGERGPEERRAYIRLAHETTRELHEFAKPVIAAVNGPARGAGTELALACDFILMADDATLAFPEATLGTCVGGGATQILPSLVGPARAKELVFTGRVLDGPAAVESGLALASYPRRLLLDHAQRLAREIGEKAPLSIRLAKQLLQRSPGADLAQALDAEAEAILECMDSEDWREGFRAFGERRKPRFQGR